MAPKVLEGTQVGGDPLQCFLPCWSKVAPGISLIFCSFFLQQGSGSLCTWIVLHSFRSHLEMQKKSTPTIFLWSNQSGYLQRHPSLSLTEIVLKITHITLFVCACVHVIYLGILSFVCWLHGCNSRDELSNTANRIPWYIFRAQSHVVACVLKLRLLQECGFQLLGVSEG